MQPTIADDIRKIIEREYGPKTAEAVFTAQGFNLVALDKMRNIAQMRYLLKYLRDTNQKLTRGASAGK